jgi:hypothetical protein
MAIGVLISAPAAQAVAPQCTTALPTHIGGNIYGYPDVNAINAYIGYDLKASGVTVDPNGHPWTQGGYGFKEWVNPTLPATGAPVGSMTWGLCVASNITDVFLEIYPRNPTGATDRSRYGGASHYRQPIVSGVDNSILLRLPVRYEVGYNVTGYVNGYITYAGHKVDPAKITRVRAFSNGSGPQCGVEGFQADADSIAYSGSLDATYYKLGVLAGPRCGAETSQSYQVTIECTDVCGHAGPYAITKTIGITNGAGQRLDFNF